MSRCTSHAPARPKRRTDHGGLTLAQPARGYRYSLDPFLLAGFCAPRRGERILDLGAGVGVIGLLLADRNPTVRVTGIELQPELARFAAANARANQLDQRFQVIRGDLREAPRFLPPEHFHRVVSNPPFRTAGSGATSLDAERAGARHELTFTLADLAATASALLRFGGTLCAIHLAERLPEIFRVFAAAGLTPKQLRLVAPYADAAPRLCLVSAAKGGRPGLSLLPPLVLHEPGGRYRREVADLLCGAAAAGTTRDKKHQPDE
jgi:tRNA1Val (adenine37-N6)-methyltransferase